jgi:hypothetical protein
MIKLDLDIVGGCSSRIERYSLAHYERDGLGLSNNFGDCGAAVGSATADWPASLPLLNLMPPTIRQPS